MNMEKEREKGRIELERKRGKTQDHEEWEVEWEGMRER